MASGRLSGISIASLQNSICADVEAGAEKARHPYLDLGGRGRYCSGDRRVDILITVNRDLLRRQSYEHSDS